MQNDVKRSKDLRIALIAVVDVVSLLMWSIYIFRAFPHI